MARKHNYDYFAAYEKLVSYSCAAAKVVEDTLRSFDYEALPKTLEEIHAIEHSADEKKHEIMKALVREFLPPIEVEDMAELAQMLDDVTDAIEDIVIKLYAYNITEILPNIVKFTDIITRSCDTMQKMLEQFSNFKKSTTLSSYIIEINRLESEGDELYTEAMHHLHATEKDPIKILTWSRMLDCLETCCDAMENVAEAIEHIVMRNL